MYSPSTFPVGMLKLKSRSKDLYLLLVLDIGLEGARLEGSGGMSFLHRGVSVTSQYE